MPTIHREAGYKFSFYSHEDGEPPHVHVRSGDGLAKLWLAPVSLAKSRGFNAREIAAIFRIVRTHSHRFLELWHGYHGTTPSDPAPRR